ncbi:hypothetical protein GWO54_05415 [Corynebacterium macginleyi]|nr:hypothetical protein [Corynebacterium macginleyi]
MDHSSIASPRCVHFSGVGPIITEHYIDTARDYQKPYWKKGLKGHFVWINRYGFPGQTGIML